MDIALFLLDMLMKSILKRPLQVFHPVYQVKNPLHLHGKILDRTGTENVRCVLILTLCFFIINDQLTKVLCSSDGLELEPTHTTIKADYCPLF